jgi:hypothetical protein
MGTKNLYGAYSGRSRSAFWREADRRSGLKAITFPERSQSVLGFGRKGDRNAGTALLTAQERSFYFGHLLYLMSLPTKTHPRSGINRGGMRLTPTEYELPPTSKG